MNELALEISDRDGVHASASSSAASSSSSSSSSPSPTDIQLIRSRAHKSWAFDSFSMYKPSPNQPISDCSDSSDSGNDQIAPAAPADQMPPIQESDDTDNDTIVHVSDDDHDDLQHSEIMAPRSVHSEHQERAVKHHASIPRPHSAHSHTSPQSQSQPAPSPSRRHMQHASTSLPQRASYPQRGQIPPALKRANPNISSSKSNDSQLHSPNIQPLRVSLKSSQIHTASSRHHQRTPHPHYSHAGGPYEHNELHSNAQCHSKLPLRSNSNSRQSNSNQTPIPNSVPMPKPIPIQTSLSMDGMHRIDSHREEPHDQHNAAVAAAAQRDDEETDSDSSFDNFSYHHAMHHGQATDSKQRPKRHHSINNLVTCKQVRKQQQNTPPNQQTKLGTFKSEQSLQAQTSKETAKFSMTNNKSSLSPRSLLTAPSPSMDDSEAQHALIHVHKIDATLPSKIVSRNRKSQRTVCTFESSLIDHEDDFDPPRPSIHLSTISHSHAPHEHVHTLSNEDERGGENGGAMPSGQSTRSRPSRHTKSTMSVESPLEVPMGQIVCTVVEEENDDESGLDVHSVVDFDRIEFCSGYLSDGLDVEFPQKHDRQSNQKEQSKLTEKGNNSHVAAKHFGLNYYLQSEADQLIRNRSRSLSVCDIDAADIQSARKSNTFYLFHSDDEMEYSQQSDSHRKHKKNFSKSKYNNNRRKLAANSMSVNRLNLKQRYPSNSQTNSASQLMSRSDPVTTKYAQPDTSPRHRTKTTTFKSEFFRNELHQHLKNKGNEHDQPHEEAQQDEEGFSARQMMMRGFRKRVEKSASIDQPHFVSEQRHKPNLINDPSVDTVETDLSCIQIKPAPSPHASPQIAAASTNNSNTKKPPIRFSKTFNRPKATNQSLAEQQAQMDKKRDVRIIRRANSVVHSIPYIHTKHNAKVNIIEVLSPSTECDHDIPSVDDRNGQSPLRYHHAPKLHVSSAAASSSHKKRSRHKKKRSFTPSLKIDISDSADMAYQEYIGAEYGMLMEQMRMQKPAALQTIRHRDVEEERARRHTNTESMTECESPFICSGNAGETATTFSQSNISSYFYNNDEYDDEDQEEQLEEEEEEEEDGDEEQDEEDGQEVDEQDEYGMNLDFGQWNGQKWQQALQEAYERGFNKGYAMGVQFKISTLSSAQYPFSR